MSKTKVDWEAVEPEYRAGIKSLRQLAEDNGCSEGAIRKKAKLKGWSRDLSGKIKAKAQELVRKAEVRSEVRSDADATEKQQIEIGAKLQSDVILAHRGKIGKFQALAESLLTELELDGKKKNNDKTKLSLGNRASILKQLSDTLKSLIALEREAFSINGAGDEDEGPGSLMPKDMSDIDAARRLAFVLNRALMIQGEEKKE